MKIVIIQEAGRHEKNKNFRESNIIEIITNPNLDLELRKTISFYVEAQK